MTQIPFVEALGDALESAAAERAPGGRTWLRPFHRRRRLVLVALALTALVVGTAAATGVFTSADRLAASSVACYDGPSLDSGASVIPVGERSPVDACRDVLRSDGPLTACAAPEHVAVLPGGRGICARAGLEPLPVDYAESRQRVNELARGIATIEASAECIAPQTLARRVQVLLGRLGWTGWRTEIREDVSQGPCAAVSSLGGDGTRSIEGALNVDDHVVYVFPEE